MLESVVDKVLAHAYLTPDTECCGLAVIVRGKLRYIPCKNELTGDTFCISSEDYVAAEELGEIVGVCHSHINISSDPSPADILACNSSKLPWLIVSIPSNRYSIVAPRQTIPSLIGREFYHGVNDCFSLARDYYATQLGIIVPDFKRDANWWDQGLDIISDNFKSYGFLQVDTVKQFDVLVMQVASKVPNHLAVYLGDDKIIHHCINRLSSRDWYDERAQRATKLILRHKDLM